MNTFKIGGISSRLLLNRLKIKYDMFEFEVWNEEEIFQGIYVKRNRHRSKICVYANTTAKYSNVTYLVNEVSKAIESKYPEALI